MMCVTHEMGFAREVADRVWFIDAGHILETAKPDDFFDAPQHIPREAIPLGSPPLGVNAREVTHVVQSHHV